MAASLGTVTSFGSTSSSPNSVVVVDAGTNLLVVFAASRFGSTGTSITGVSYAGSALTKLGSITSGSTSNLDLWYKTNPATGSNTLTVTQTSGNPIYTFGCIPILGADTTDPFRSQGANLYVTSTGNPTGSGSVTVTSSATDIPLAAIEFVSDTDITVSSNGTQLYDQRYGGVNLSESAGQTASGSSSVTMTFTLGSSVNNCTFGVSVKAATVAASPSYRSMMGIGG